MELRLCIFMSTLTFASGHSAPADGAWAVDYHKRGVLTGIWGRSTTCDRQTGAFTLTFVFGLLAAERLVHGGWAADQNEVVVAGRRDVGLGHVLGHIADAALPPLRWSTICILVNCVVHLHGAICYNPHHCQNDRRATPVQPIRHPKVWIQNLADALIW